MKSGGTLSDFESAYNRLNKQQKLAVDEIEGPVMVIAGPGTGKTQLLSVRAANILKQTDVRAENILCLTFTDSAASEMRDRLVGLIGQDGYQVNVSTFHSFGTDIIGRYPEYFYKGAHMQPIDDLGIYTILHDLFKKMPHSNPLSKQFNDEHTYLKDAQTAISQLKKAAIDPSQLTELVKQNQAFVDFAEPMLSEAFGEDRLSKKTLPTISKALNELKDYEDDKTSEFTPLSEVLTYELEQALLDGTTPPVSAWKRKWLRKDATSKLVLKNRKRNQLLKALSSLFSDYQKQLDKSRLFDYDDMVMQVVKELETNSELKAELQEQYLYILVDEFQDTNDAQMKLIKNVLDNPVNEGRPNVLVVGDDDQAIYKFQGANITNMHKFTTWVEKPEIVPLTDIYRYPKKLLEVSNDVITRIDERLTDGIEGVEKDLVSIPKTTFNLERNLYQDESTEYYSISEDISKLIKNGAEPEDIAVIARQHNHLEKMSAYLSHFDIPVSYERRDNILDNPKIRQLLFLAETVIEISKGNRARANGRMPELLSFDFWGIEPNALWSLNKKVQSKSETWLDVMINEKKFSNIAKLLLETAKSSQNDPMTYTVDLLIGAGLSEDNNSYKSPFFDYYFSDINDQEFLNLLSDLKTLKAKLEIHSKSKDLKLGDLVDFIALQKQADVKLVSTNPVSVSQNAVELITAHKSKGMEFDHVFILHAQDEIWGSKRRGRSSLISFPENLLISPAGDNENDRVRLFYVALTRAKTHLSLSSSRIFNDKPSLPLRLLEAEEGSGSGIKENEVIKSHDEINQAYTLDWTSSLTNLKADDKPDLKPYLQNYKLSISHLQTYVDVVQAGPKSWLLYNLLKFPGPVIAPAAYGSAIHQTLNEAQKYLSRQGERKSSDKLLQDFNKYLKDSHLSESDYNYYREKGDNSLRLYLEQYYNNYSSDDKSEVNFYSDNVTIGGAQVTGMIDRLNLKSGTWSKGSVELVDFKTGKSSKSWKGRSEFEKLKMYRYRQQLIFYTLLMEESPRFKNIRLDDVRLEFVEPNEENEILPLSLKIEESEKTRLISLVVSVWNKIQDLDIIDISAYPETLEGLTKFEDDLINS